MTHAYKMDECIMIRIQSWLKLMSPPAPAVLARLPGVTRLRLGYLNQSVSKDTLILRSQLWSVLHVANSMAFSIILGLLAGAVTLIFYLVYKWAVADLGFSERGFFYSIAREEHAKNYAITLTLVKPRPFPIVLERDFLLYLSIDPLLIKIYSKAC